MFVNGYGRFLELRDRLSVRQEHQDTLLLEAGVDPPWAQRYNAIVGDIGQVGEFITRIASKQVQRDNNHYQEALNSEIMFMRNDLLREMQRVSVAVNSYGALQKSNDEEFCFLHRHLVTCLRSQMASQSQRFRELQTQFLSAVQKQQQQQHSQLVGANKEALGYYLQAEQQINQDHREVVSVCKDINEIVEMVSQLAQQVYECGTILDRIDHNLTDAENFVQQGNKNLDQTAQDQKRSGVLRMMVYVLIAVNYVLSATMIALKVCFRN